VFQRQELHGWQIMDFSMTKMKQLAHIAESVAENGISPKLKSGNMVLSTSIGVALKNALENVSHTRRLHSDLLTENETGKHSGLIINLDLAIKQEAYEADEIHDWLAKEI
jgi:bacterioferritin